MSQKYTKMSQNYATFVKMSVGPATRIQQQQTHPCRYYINFTVSTQNSYIKRYPKNIVVRNIQKLRSILRITGTISRNIPGYPCDILGFDHFDRECTDFKAAL